MFSELDGALESLGVQADTASQNLNVWDKTKWAVKEESIEKILKNLQTNKISLQWMLSIYLWFVTRVPYFYYFLVLFFSEPNHEDSNICEQRVSTTNPK